MHTYIHKGLTMLGMALINVFLRAMEYFLLGIIFFTTLFYLLSSEKDFVGSMLSVAVMEETAKKRITSLCYRAVRGVFWSTLKVFTFNLLFTWVRTFFLFIFFVHFFLPFFVHFFLPFFVCSF